MIDSLILENLKISIGKIIVFYDTLGKRYEGKILAVSEDYIQFYDTFKDNQKFFRLERISEVEIK